MVANPKQDQRVRVLPTYCEERLRGRVGTIVKVPKTFPGYPYVKLDMRPRERRQKIEMIEAKHLELCDVPAPAKQERLPMESAS